MALVAIAAVDCALILSPFSGRPAAEGLLLLGSLPMLNLLALVALAALPPVGTGRGLFACGFLLAGAAAAAVTAWLVAAHPERVREAVVGVVRPFRPYGNPLYLGSAAAVLLAPQVAAAAVGGRACAGLFGPRARG
jgi:hypothetical protein